MLLEGSLWFLFEQSIYAFVEVLRRHIVVNYADARDVNCTTISASFHIIGNFGKLALLLHDLDRLLSRSALWSSNALLNVFCQFANQGDWFLFIFFRACFFLVLIKDRFLAFSDVRFKIYLNHAARSNNIFARVSFHLGWREAAEL